MEEGPFRPRPFGQAYCIVQNRRRSMAAEFGTAQWERVFTSRKRTLMQKASDLEISTRCKVTLTIKSPAGQVWYYATSDQLRQKLANAEIIDSTSFRVTRETLENNLIPTPENIPSDCDQPQQPSTLSMTAERCENCQANRSNLPDRESKSSGDHLERDRLHASAERQKQETNLNSNHIHRTPLGDNTDSRLHGSRSNDSKLTKAGQVGNKTENESAQSHMSKKINKIPERSRNSERSAANQDKKRKSTVHDNHPPNAKISPAKSSKRQRTGVNETHPQQAVNHDSSKKSRQFGTNARQHVQTRLGNRNSHQNVNKNKNKDSVDSSKPQNNKHIVFSDSEGDILETKPVSSKNTRGLKTKPTMQRSLNRKQHLNHSGDLGRCSTTKNVSKNVTRTDNLSSKGTKIAQESSSRANQKSYSNVAANILGFARFPFQPPLHRFTTEAELEEERKYLPSRSSAYSEPPKLKTTTTVPSDSSSSTSTSSSDSSSSSEDSSDEDESSSSSTTDDSPVTTPVRNTKSQRSLQTTTTVETVESSVTEKSPPRPNVFLPKYEGNIPKGRTGFMAGKQHAAFPENLNCFVKVEKNPYDFFPSPTKVPQADHTEETMKNKENGTINARPNIAEDTRSEELRNTQQAKKTNPPSKAPAKPSSNKQTKSGNAIKNAKGELENIPNKNLPQKSHHIIKQESISPQSSNSSNTASHTRQNKFSRRDTGMARNNHKCDPPRHKPKTQRPDSRGAKPGSEVKTHAYNIGNKAKKLLENKQTRKRQTSESSNCSNKKARSQTPDGRPSGHSRPNYRRFRRNSDSWNGTDWRQHAYPEGQKSFRRGQRNNRHGSCWQEPGLRREESGMSKDDYRESGNRSPHGMSVNQNASRIFDSESAASICDNHHNDSTHATPIRPSLLPETLDSLPGYYPMRRQHSTTSLDEVSRHKPFWPNHYNEDTYDLGLHKSFDRKDDYEQDDFEKQLRDKCFSLRDNPPKYQLFDEDVDGNRRFSTGGIRNSRLDMNLRNLSESPACATSRSPSLSTRYKIKPSKHQPKKKKQKRKKVVLKKAIRPIPVKPSKQQPKKKRKPLSKQWKRPSPKKTVAKVKPFSQK